MGYRRKTPDPVVPVAIPRPCDQLRYYLSRGAALEVRHALTFGPGIAPFQCPWCNRWHLVGANTKERLLKQLPPSWPPGPGNLVPIAPKREKKKKMLKKVLGTSQ